MFWKGKGSLGAVAATTRELGLRARIWTHNSKPTSDLYHCSWYKQVQFSRDSSQALCTSFIPFFVLPPLSKLVNPDHFSIGVKIQFRILNREAFCRDFVHGVHIFELSFVCQ